MVYKLKTMKLKTKVIFLCVVWIFSAFCAVLGAATISLAFVVSTTPYDYQENPLIDQIWDDLGSFINYSIPAPITGTPIWGNIIFDNDYYFVSFDSGMRNKSTDLSIIYNERQNGSVSYDYVSQRLSLQLYNGTRFDVQTSQQSLYFDLINKEFRLNPNRNEEQLLNQEIWINNTLISSRKISYFDVSNRDLIETSIEMGYGILQSFPSVFLDVGLNFLVFVAIGGGFAMITAFIFAGLQVTRWGGGRRWTYFLLRLLRGKFGRIISKIPFFDFGGDWYIEESFVNEINLSTTRSTLSELFSERWYDLLVFPPLLASIIINLLLLRIPFENKGAALFTTPFVAPLVLVILVFYYPVIWSFNEGGFKKIEIGPQGDIVVVKPLGNVIRAGLGIIVGFSGIVSVSSFGVEVARSLAYEQTVQGNIIFAGIAFDWFGLILLILMAIGIFLILLSSSIVGASLIGLQYLQTNHVSNIVHLRQRSYEKKLISNFGSLHYRFNPEPKEIVISEE